MSKFPQFLFALQFHCPRSVNNSLRRFAAYVIVAVLVLAPASLQFRASAQEPSVPSKDSSYDHFIVYTDGKGNTICRVADKLERMRLDQVNPSNLRQLNHVGREKREGFSIQADNVLPTHLTIILRGTARLEANTPAKNAFLRAAQAWENLIKSPVTIYLDADVGPDFFNNPNQPFSPGTIGQTSSPQGTANYQSVRGNLILGASNANESSVYNALPASSVPTDLGNATTVSVNASIARAIGLIDPTAQPTEPAARIGFNSNFNFDYDPSDGVVGTDFESVATHEIGHALGFTSRAGQGIVRPAILDLFRFRNGVDASTFTTAQRILSIGGPPSDPLQFYFFPNEPQLGLSTGGPEASTTNNGDGNQSSHWKHSVQNGGVLIGIMDPRLPANVHRTIDANDLRALNSFGYNLENNNAPPPPPPPPPTPGNDSFANAQVISGCSGTVNGTNIGATKEQSESSHSPDNNGGGGSVWYQWQATSDGQVTITTEGSTYDTLLAVYTGQAVNDLTFIAKNDDVSLANVVTSTVTFTARIGTVYRIAVDGWGGESGNIQLNWSQPSCLPFSSSTVQVASSTISVGEDAGTASIVVNRSNSAGSATVDYSTNDFSATRCDTAPAGGSAKCDYATAGGKLQFAPGESSKTIAVSIINDAFIEGNETLSVTLSNPVGSTLGGSTTNITIVDNDSDANAANPFLNNGFFVRQQYLDFLLREPDTAGFNDWNNVLANCQPNGGFLGSPPGCDRIHVSSGFFRSTEFGEKGYWIYRFYEIGLGRRPQFAEFMPEMRRLSGLMSDAEQEARRADFISRFMQSPAFAANFSGLRDSFNDAPSFVARLEQVGRVTLPASATTEPGQPPQYGRQQLIDKMASGEFTADQTFRAFIEQKVVWDTYFYRAFVAMQYFGYLRRDPEDAGYNDWVDVLTNGRSSAGIAPGDYRHLIFGFVYSVEYRERFGKQ